MRKVCVLLFGCLSCVLVSAQNNDRLLDWPMYPATLSVNINADPFTVTTRLEMKFCNTNAKEAEALYRFELMPGQVITRFQLELNGKYRDGSVEEQWKARNAYNTTVGKRVDPALLSMESYNHYRLNIYPVPAGGCRKVAITIQQLWKPQNGRLEYKLPINIGVRANHFMLTITAQHCNTGIPVAGGLISGENFTANGYTSKLEWKKDNLMLDQPLMFSMPYSLAKPFICVKRNGSKDFLAMRLIPGIPKNNNFSPGNIAVYWDISATGRERDIDKEIEFLAAYIKRFSISRLSVITFNQTIQDSAVFFLNNGQSRWKGYLQGQRYEGATSYGCLDFAVTDADAILLFSDGKNSFGKDKPQDGHLPVWCISTAKLDDSTRLSNIAGKTGGQYISLLNRNIDMAVSMTCSTENMLIKIRSGETEVALTEQMKGIKNDTLFLTGEIPAGSSSVILEYGNSGKVREVQTVGIDSCAYVTVSAVDRMEMLNHFSDYSPQSELWYQELRFGVKEAVVTSGTSFIVLEKIDDYIRFGIIPPVELQGECDMNIFVNAEKQRQHEYKQLTEQEIFQLVGYAYNDRIAQADKHGQFVAVNNNQVALDNKWLNGRSSSSPVSETGNNNSFADGIIVEPAAAGGNVTTLNEVVVTAMGQRSPAKQLGYTVSRISAADLTQAKSFNLQNGLTGKTSGLVVQSVNNGVFQDTRLTLRGIRSLTGNNQPMLVLDGTPVALGYISSLNPNDVQEVTILKSAAATAIYGPDGVNGALLVNTKLGFRNNDFVWQSYRLKDRADVDYVMELKHTPERNLLARYEEMRTEHKWEAGFYMDAAQVFFDAGLKQEAINILYTALDVSNGNEQVAEAAGYLLEYWHAYGQAIMVYKNLVNNNPSTLNYCRSLALAYYQNGEFNNAVNTYYKGILTNMGSSETLLNKFKALMLQEMNAVIAAHKDLVDISGINPRLIHPLQYDLRVTLDCNTRSIGNNVTVTEPGGKICTRDFINKGDGKLTDHLNTGVEEYQVRQAKTGKYKIGIKYYGSYSPGVPVLIRILTFRQTAKGPVLEVENAMMDNQYGNVEIAEIKW